MKYLLWMNLAGVLPTFNAVLIAQARAERCDLAPDFNFTQGISYILDGLVFSTPIVHGSKGLDLLFVASMLGLKCEMSLPFQSGNLRSSLFQPLSKGCCGPALR
eukprot:3937508-Pleurochrysis_carterae.AAC.2